MRLPSWQLKTLGLLSITAGAVVLYLGLPDDYPAESELVKVSGSVERVTLRDDISGTTAGAVLPGWSSAYITLEGVEGEFRYPRNHPKNSLVRDYTGGTLEIWVEESALGRPDPAIIWQIVEDNPYKRQNSEFLPDETNVTYAETIAHLEEISRSLLELGGLLMTGGLALFGLGMLAKRWNRRSADGRSPQ